MSWPPFRDMDMQWTRVVALLEAMKKHTDRHHANGPPISWTGDFEARGGGGTRRRGYQEFFFSSTRKIIQIPNNEAMNRTVDGWSSVGGWGGKGTENLRHVETGVSKTKTRDQGLFNDSPTQPGPRQAWMEFFPGDPRLLGVIWACWSSPGGGV